jgi:hypothetical protein
VSSKPIGGMRDNRTGEHPNDHGGCQHEPDVLCLQSAFVQQRWDEWRLHAECRGCAGGAATVARG